MMIAPAQASGPSVLDLLAHLSRPFIDREVMAIAHSEQPVTIDLDLTGRPVSPTATTYPEAAFGWMDDAVAKGYQSAISSLSGGPTGRLLLASQRYSGKAKSAECLQAAVQAAEAALAIRPRRRVELVEAQLERLAAGLSVQQQHLETATEALDTAEWKLERHARGRRDERYAAQQARLTARVVRVRGKVERLQGQVAQLQGRQQQLRAWAAQLAAENQVLSAPLKVVMRLDAGFATAVVRRDASTAAQSVVHLLQRAANVGGGHQGEQRGVHDAAAVGAFADRDAAAGGICAVRGELCALGGGVGARADTRSSARVEAGVERSHDAGEGTGA